MIDVVICDCVVNPNDRSLPCSIRIIFGNFCGRFHKDVLSDRATWNVADHLDWPAREHIEKEFPQAFPQAKFFFFWISHQPNLTDRLPIFELTRGGESRSPTLSESSSMYDCWVPNRAVYDVIRRRDCWAKDSKLSGLSEHFILLDVAALNAELGGQTKKTWLKINAHTFAVEVSGDRIADLRSAIAKHQKVQETRLFVYEKLGDVAKGAHLREVDYLTETTASTPYVVEVRKDEE